mmetsp:Transcript_8118/g.12433  ORF Transcript_8118/g.12433 Transcript_8118/m.12433 type:complete len:338 (+) Transcript_8118:97-1110(+)
MAKANSSVMLHAQPEQVLSATVPAKQARYLGEEDKSTLDQARCSNKRIKLEPSVSCKTDVKCIESSGLGSIVTPEYSKISNATKLQQYQMALAVDGLAKLHPEVVEENSIRREKLRGKSENGDTITDSVISTMLSQNTTAANSDAAFLRLKEEFPTWNKVTELSPSNLFKLESAIRVAGLSKVRAQRIHGMLAKLKQERQKPSFEYLRSMSNEQIKEELGRFKGLGPKTISCVLMFSLARSEFPVDTHVLRISKSLNWVPQSATRESAYDYLNSCVPPKLKMDLHCLLVTHGRQCHNCAANKRPQFPPNDGTKLVCPLRGLSNVTKPDVIVKSEPIS